ncbi:MAG: diaminopimelate epimerase [Bacteroidales bacterium]
MIIPFNKYQGTGNDFVIIDNRRRIFNPKDNALVSRLCDRRFGIGADGLILISDSCGLDFEMRYFNSDGNESTMCGNGGRCSAAFAYKNGIAGSEQRFLTADGIHKAQVTEEVVRLRMNEVTGIKTMGENLFINTGSPHFVTFTEQLAKLDVVAKGREIRWSETFSPGGTNVNFVELLPDGIFVRTFERGVEDETLSCGTGVTASAIASVFSGHFDTGKINVSTKGGKLTVEFSIEGDSAKEIWLTGPATFVFGGNIDIPVS